MAKPFLKWAGGKTQLLETISTKLPPNFGGKKFTYIEPFVGSGAMLFWILENFSSSLENIIINDINSDLIQTYRTIRDEAQNLIDLLKEYESDYHQLDYNSEERKAYFYAKRSLYNQRTQSQVEQAALFIFLNKTCFNGLYRVNRKNEFNVPIGSYKKPTICQEENLKLVSEALQRVTILNGDYQETIKYVGMHTFFYFDPPYKPLSLTSSFNSYTKDEFDDEEQKRLKLFCDKLTNEGCFWLLSNSDVQSVNPDDTFFDDLYDSYIIERVSAKRMINAKANKRGLLKELLIRNYNIK